MYILPDADIFVRLAFGVRAMQIYFERTGNAFDARLIDNLAHKEMAWLRNPGIVREAEADMDADVVRFVRSVEAAEAKGKTIF